MAKQNFPFLEVVEAPETRRNRDIFSHRKAIDGKYAEYILLLEELAISLGVKKADVYKVVFPAIADVGFSRSGTLDIYVEATDTVHRLPFNYGSIDEFLAEARTWDLTSNKTKESKEVSREKLTSNKNQAEELDEKEDKDSVEQDLSQEPGIDLDLNLDFSQAKK